MIDYNDLINRIESMQDLPISEEMIGAYCEGLLNSVDAASMDSYIANDAEIGELVDSVDNSQGSDNLYSFGYGTDGIDDFDLPYVPMSNSINPFGIEIISNMDEIGMIAVVADSNFSGIPEDFGSASDDFISDDSISNDDDINKGDSFDSFNF